MIVVRCINDLDNHTTSWGNGKEGSWKTSVEPLVKTCYTLRRKLVSAGHQYGRNRHMQACVYAHLTQAHDAKGVRKGMDHYYEKRNQYR